MNRLRVIRASIAVCLFLWPISGQAGTIVFSNFYDLQPVFDWNSAYAISTYSYSGIAAAFTPAVSGTLATIELPGAYLSDSSAVLKLALTEDAGGYPTTTPLESFQFTPLHSVYQVRTWAWDPLIGTSTARPLLQAGQQYWLAVVADLNAEYNPEVYWFSNRLNSPWGGVAGLVASRGWDTSEWTSGQWTQPAFRITVDEVTSPVPEPGAFWLLAGGMLAVALRRCRAA